MSLFLLNNNKKKIYNPRQKFGSSLALWINPKFSPKTFNGSSISQINDLSGNNKHAVQSTATKQPSYVTNGYIGLPYLSFARANIQNMAIDNLFIGGIQTVVMVLKRIGTNSNYIGGFGSYNELGWQLYINPDYKLTIQPFKSGTNTGIVVNSPLIPADEAHIAVVVDNINLKVKAYLNGLKMGSDYVLPWQFVEGTHRIRLFSDYWGTNSNVTGEGNLYNCFIVNRELSPVEIAQDYIDWTKYRT